MVKRIAVVLSVIGGSVLAFAATQPDAFRVHRSATIDAPPEKIYAHIEDLRRLNVWNPFDQKGPKGTYGAVSAGKGAAYSFEGGRLEILDALPASEVRMRLDMVKPMQASNVVEFTLRPEGNATRVTWAIQGPMPYVSKLFSLFCDMDAMIGKEFESGLANLKTIVER